MEGHLLTIMARALCSRLRATYTEPAPAACGQAAGDFDASSAQAHLQESRGMYCD